MCLCVLSQIHIIHFFKAENMFNNCPRNIRIKLDSKMLQKLVASVYKIAKLI